MPDELNDQYVAPRTELGLAFATAASTQQENGSKEQDPKGEPVVTTTGQADPKDSRSNDGSTDSSRDEANKLREEVLAGLTLEELKAHPTLGRVLQSHTDQEVARSLQGKTKQIETQVTQRIAMEQAKTHFESLDPDELGEELAKDPEARKMYGLIQTAPPPTTPDPAAQGAVEYYTRTIKFWDQKISQAQLPKELVDKLNPDEYLKGEGDADAILARWTADVDRTITEFVVTKELAKANDGKSESDSLDAKARLDAANKGGPLIGGGKNSTPLPELGSTSGRNLLEDAFTRTSRMTNRS